MDQLSMKNMGVKKIWIKKNIKKIKNMDQLSIKNVGEEKGKKKRKKKFDLKVNC